MTDQQTVKRRHPDAFVDHMRSVAWEEIHIVLAGPWPFRHLGLGFTEAEAWENAASRIARTSAPLSGAVASC